MPPCFYKRPTLVSTCFRYLKEIQRGFFSLGEKARSENSVQHLICSQPGQRHGGWNSKDTEAFLPQNYTHSQGAIALSNVYGHPCFICSFCAFISRMCPLVSERPKRGDFGV